MGFYVLFPLLLLTLTTLTTLTPPSLASGVSSEQSESTQPQPQPQAEWFDPSPLDFHPLTSTPSTPSTSTSTTALTPSTDLTSPSTTPWQTQVREGHTALEENKPTTALTLFTHLAHDPNAPDEERAKAHMMTALITDWIHDGADSSGTVVEAAFLAALGVLTPESDPDVYADVYTNYCIFQLHRNHLTEAYRRCRQALRLRPHSSFIQDILSDIDTRFRRPRNPQPQ